MDSGSEIVIVSLVQFLFFPRTFLQEFDKKASGHEKLVEGFARDALKSIDERTRVVKKQLEMCKEEAETNEIMLCDSYNVSVRQYSISSPTL